MSKTEIENQYSKLYAEELLPVEKKLIAWSLGTGIVLLIVLAVLSRLYPI